jgi:uncharacterized protein YbjQ (UPF0145 family)
MTEPPFGSTLSVGSFLAVRNAGFRPLRQVQGTSVLSLGWQRPPKLGVRRALQPKMLSGGAGVYGTASNVYFPKGSLAVQQYLNEGGWLELEQRTAAYNDARRQALARLRDAAREAGALAVVDVRIRRGRFAHTTRAIEFTAIGTALGSDRFDLEEDEPIPVVNLSGGDFWKLVTSGYWPLGVVGGTSVIYVTSGYRTKYARFRLSKRSVRNQEYDDYTNGLYEARIRAQGRMRQEARELGATGVLSIEVGRERQEQKEENLIVTVDLLGNAIAPIEQGTPREIHYALGIGNR